MYSGYYPPTPYQTRIKNLVAQVEAVFCTNHTRQLISDLSRVCADDAEFERKLAELTRSIQAATTLDHQLEAPNFAPDEHLEAAYDDKYENE